MLACENLMLKVNTGSFHLIRSSSISFPPKAINQTLNEISVASQARPAFCSRKYRILSGPRRLGAWVVTISFDFFEFFSPFITLKYFPSILRFFRPLTCYTCLWLFDELWAENLQVSRHWPGKSSQPSLAQSDWPIWGPQPFLSCLSCTAHLKKQMHNMKGSVDTGDVNRNERQSSIAILQSSWRKRKLLVCVKLAKEKMVGVCVTKNKTPPKYSLIFDVARRVSFGKTVPLQKPPRHARTFRNGRIVRFSLFLLPKAGCLFFFFLNIINVWAQMEKNDIFFAQTRFFPSIISIFDIKMEKKISFSGPTIEKNNRISRPENQK